MLGADEGSLAVGPADGSLSVQGHVDIDRNGALKTLEGLNITAMTKRLRVLANASLESLTGLEGLVSFAGSVELVHNPKLKNLGGLSGLPYIYLLRVRGNDVLTSLTGLGAQLTQLGILIIRENDVLHNLDGLAGIASVGAEVVIDANGNLTDIAALGTRAPGCCWWWGTARCKRPTRPRSRRA